MDLTGLITFLHASKYVLIFAGSYLEGSVVMLATGALWHSGLVAFWPAYLALLLGDILSDSMWYWLGRIGARPFVARWGPLCGATPEIISRVERRFHEYHLSILIISKLTMGFGLAVATLVTAGLMRIPFGRYFTIQLIGGIVWVYALVMVGYYFGNILERIPREFQIAAGILALIGAVLVLRYVGKKLARMEW
jgi:membrane protein DedA with SNARE-associated domain